MSFTTSYMSSLLEAVSNLKGTRASFFNLLIQTALAIVFTFLVTSAYGQQVEIGRANNAIHAWGQKWKTVSGNAYFHKRVLKGEVILISRNLGDWGPPFNDGDWNIYVQPTSQFQSLLQNSDGDENSHDNSRKNRKVEIELLNPFPLNNYFKVGDEIEVFGWWVEDSGHDDKTEIHPLINLRKTDGYKSYIFSATDASGRFNRTHPNGSLSSHDDYKFKEPFNSFESRLNLGDTQNSMLSVNTVIEKATFDKMSDSRLVNERTAVGRPVVLGDKLVISPEFKKGLALDENNRNSYASTLTRPFYFGEFTHAGEEENVLREVIEKKFVDVGGKQAIEYNIRLSFNALSRTNQGREGFSSFKYEGVNRFGEVEAFKKESSSDHFVDFKIQYSPEKGLSQKYFEVNVFGYEKALNLVSNISGFDRSENSTYYRAKRTYKINSSELNMYLDQKPSRFDYVCSTPRIVRVPCATGFKLTPEINFIDPNVFKEGRYNWKFRVLGGGPSGDNSPFVYSEIPNPLRLLPASPVELPSVEPEVTTTQVYEFVNFGDSLLVEFLDENQGYFESDRDLANFSRPTAIEIVCYTKTSLGEEVSFSTVLQFPVCKCDQFDLHVVPDLFYRLVSGLLVADRLGMDFQQMTRQGVGLPRKFIQQFPRTILSSTLSIDDLKEYEFKIGANKVLLQALLASGNRRDFTTSKTISDLFVLGDELLKLPSRVKLDVSLKENNIKNTKRVIAKYNISNPLNRTENLIEIEKMLIDELSSSYTFICGPRQRREANLIIRKLISRGVSRRRMSILIREGEEAGELKIRRD